MNTSSELLPEAKNRILTNSSLLCIDDQYFKIRTLFPADLTFGDSNFSTVDNFKLKDGNSLDPTVAYLIGDYYYFYRGKIVDLKGFDEILPGIYYDDDRCIYTVKDPETEEEKQKYKFSDKITRQDVDEIRRAVFNHEVVIFNTPDSAHSVIPPESADDDLLKRIIKRAIITKGIDLDQYKLRFASKNMLFNTKQVLRGPNRLSMLLFDRCAEALNLKYTIVVEEAGGEIIGVPLSEDIIISSADTFNANMLKAQDNLK